MSRFSSQKSFKEGISRITWSSNKHFTFNHWIFFSPSQFIAVLQALLKLFFFWVSTGICSPVASLLTPKLLFSNRALSKEGKMGEKRNLIGKLLLNWWAIHLCIPDRNSDVIALSILRNTGIWFLTGHSHVSQEVGYRCTKSVHYTRLCMLGWPNKNVSDKCFTVCSFEFIKVFSDSSFTFLKPLFWIFLPTE